MKRVGDRVMHILAPMSNMFVLLMGTAVAMVSEFASRLCKKNSLVTMRSSICFYK